MTPGVPTQNERTLKLAVAFLDECKRDLERALVAGADVPPRIRCVHARPGHATPEYRTLAVPVPEGAAGASPEVLSELIARWAAVRPPLCLMLALDAVTRTADGGAGRVLISEVRDRAGGRFFLVQPFRVEGTRVVWEEPVGGGWRDPGEEEMVLDAAFAPPPVMASPGAD